MKINFTKKEYCILVEMISVANWIILNEAKKEDDNQYERLEQKLLSFAKNFGFEENVIYDRELGKYFTTADFEENKTLKHIEKYEDGFFWDELSYRLAVRDLWEEFGEEKIRQMDIDERFGRICRAEEKYNEEFENNGLENLKID
ncbi:MAG: hypothetical protein ACOX2N_09355 [Peptococcia bacterium]|jgi:hypothetical protein